MSEILFENSLAIIVFGLFVFVPMVMLANHYSDWRIWAGAVAILVLIVGLVALERYVVSPREKLRSTVSEMAKWVQRNEHERLLEYFSERMPEVRQQAKMEMPSYDFSRCSVTSFNEVKLDANNPNRGSVDFTVGVTLLLQGMKQSALRDVTLIFEKESDGTWRVVQYSHRAPFREPGTFF